jgi:ParB family chromosome partitioning protein
LLGGSANLAKPAAATGTTASTVFAVPEPSPRERILRVPLARLRPCPLQPRKDFPEETLRELADSIREQGIVQPLIVREQGGFLELIAGERRWRAAQLAGLTEVPVIVREADDRAVLELALIENLQRENLNALEEAQGYAQLASQFQLTQEEIAVKVGKSRAAVANALRLLKLTPLLQDFLRDGRLSVGHAKVLLGLDDLKHQQHLAERAIKESLNVRQTEKLVARLLLRPPAERRHAPELPPLADAHIAGLENQLRERFGTKVSLHYQQGQGSVEIKFFNDADLERILQIAGVTVE